jgi:site-specific recombinase XerD
MNLYEIKEVLGHSDIKTTMRYAHLEQAAVSLKVKEVMNKLNRAASQHGTDTTSGTL